MLLKVILVLVTISYPFLIYFGLSHFNSSIVMIVLVTLLVARWLMVKQSAARNIILVSILAMLVATYLLGSKLGLKIYPVAVNISMLILFAASLTMKQTVIEKLARIKEPDLPLSGVNYTRKVTYVWCVFFLINGAISLVTALWASNEIWLFYNGFLAYLMIGSLMVLEWLIRPIAKRKL